MMKRTVIVIMILAAIVLVPAAQAATAKYIIGVGSTTMNATGGAVNPNVYDTRWSELSGMGTQTLTGTDLTKSVKVDGVSVFLTFDFEMTMTSTGGTTDVFMERLSTNGADQKYTLGTTEGINKFISPEDSISFKFTNIRITEGYKFTSLVLASFMTSTNVTGTDNKMKVTYNGTAKTRALNNLDDLALTKMTKAAIPLGTPIVDGKVGTIQNLGNRGDAGDKANLANLRVDFAAELIPEPATLAMLGFGALMTFRRKRKA